MPPPKIAKTQNVSLFATAVSSNDMSSVFLAGLNI
jgi:hypothetical protein